MAHLFASQILDDSGDPLASGKVYTYEAGTTTPLASYPTYADAVAGTNANANPLRLDAAGRGQVWLTDVGYKARIDTSADVTLETVDNIYGSGNGQVITIDGSNNIDFTILADNSSQALTFKESGNNYINFSTADDAETITFSNTSQYADIELLGTVGIRNAAMKTTWDTTQAPLQIGGTGAIWNETTAGASKSLFIGQNVFDHSSNGLSHITTDESSWIKFTAGTIEMYGATSGTGDAAISTQTLGLTVEDDGKVSIGAGSFYADDVRASFGGTVAVPYAHIEWDTASRNGLLIATDTTGDLVIASNSGDILLEPTGGEVKFGSHLAVTTETLSGYITIRDAAGTYRKVGIVS